MWWSSWWCSCPAPGPFEQDLAQHLGGHPDGKLAPGRPSAAQVGRDRLERVDGGGVGAGRSLDEDGGLALFGNQSSGVLTSAFWADGLLDNPAGQAFAKGDAVRFLPFSELLS